MTYKDLILKLLASRENLVCLEEHLMSDFNENNNPDQHFSEWCEKNDIIFKRVTSEYPAKLSLKKKRIHL